MNFLFDSDVVNLLLKIMRGEMGDLILLFL